MKKICLITGGTSKLGQNIAKFLHNSDYKVFIQYNNSFDLANVFGTSYFGAHWLGLCKSSCCRGTAIQLHRFINSIHRTMQLLKI